VPPRRPSRKEVDTALNLLLWLDQECARGHSDESLEPDELQDVWNAADTARRLSQPGDIGYSAIAKLQAAADPRHQQTSLTFRQAARAAGRVIAGLQAELDNWPGSGSSCAQPRRPTVTARLRRGADGPVAPQDGADGPVTPGER
jgi:hypothetical protein